MVVRRMLLTLVVLASLTGCAGPKVLINGQEVYEKHWRLTMTELGARARFDLGCETSQFEFALFKKIGRHPSEVGVAGCGKRATYVRQIVQSYIGPWSVNVLSE